VFGVDPIQLIVSTIFLLPGLLVGLVLHEAAHAAVAVARGDETPRLDGRLSLNPAHHLDPLGTIAVVLVHFGWAKPVRINPRRMHHWYDPALVAAAGPLTNFLIALALSIPLKLAFAGGLGSNLQMSFAQPPIDILMTFAVVAFYLNVVLAVFNLLPIPPLDGYNLVATLLRRQFPAFFARVDANSQVISLVLLVLLFFVPGVRALVFSPIYSAAGQWLLGGQNGVY
jgi:Zn-dependent protease